MTVKPTWVAAAAFGLLLLAVPAFWPNYLARWRSAESYTHAHAALGLAWLLVLVAQPLLIHARKAAAHRIVGRVALALSAAFVVAGLLLAHRGIVRMSEEELRREGFTLYLPLVMTAIYAAAVGGGWAWRKVPALHGRFMACTLLPLLDPVFARLVYFYLPPPPAEWLFQMPAFTLSAVVVLLLARQVPGPAAGRQSFRVFAGGAIVALALYFATPYSSSWLAFVAWFRSLPVT